ncbi:putative membrane protein [Desulfosporosinus sp. OT]|nr:putative membrane protein [Desulfosporosinus sp. OT]
MFKNNLIRTIIVLLAFWLLASALYNVNWVYRSVFIATMVVCLLVIWVSKRKFGMDKILYLKAYIL